MEDKSKRQIVQWTARRPPPSGPGSGRDDWMRFAMAISQANRMLWEAMETQSRTIDDLEAEIMRLRVGADPVRDAVEVFTPCPVPARR